MSLLANSTAVPYPQFTVVGEFSIYSKLHASISGPVDEHVRPCLLDEGAHISEPNLRRVGNVDVVRIFEVAP